MKFILIAAVLFVNGETQSLSHPFATMAECEAQLPTIGSNIGEYNVSADVKIVGLAAACVPAQKVPQGRDI